MKKLLSILGIMFVLLGVTACETEVDAANAYVTIDINPSFEVLTDDDGLILEVVSGNEDADVVLYGLELKGKKLSDGVKLMVEESYNLGFVKGEKNVVIGVCKNQNSEALLNHLYKEVRAMKELQLRVHKDYQAGVNEELDNLKGAADKMNMKLSEYRMALRLQTGNAEMTFEKVRHMNVKEANESISKNAWMYRHRSGQLKEMIDDYKKFQSKNILRKARIVNALGKLILATNPKYIKELSGEDVEAEALVSLYGEYVRALESVNIIAVDADYTDLIAAIEADPDFVELDAQFKATLAEINELFTSTTYDQNIITALEEKLILLDDLNKRINEKINAIINDDTLVGYYFKGTIIISPVVPVLNPYAEIREEYALKFNDLGIPIEAYEAHILAVLSRETIYGAIKAEFEALIGEFEAELNNLKDLCEQAELEYEIELKYKNEYLQAKVRIRKGKNKQ